MGKSVTWNVLAFYNERHDRERGVVQESILPCMTKTEMAQAVLKAEREGHTIISFAAQTEKGYKMLGGNWSALLEDVKLPKLVTCPVCYGAGCPVCDYAGACRKGHEKKWRPWQLEMMQRDALNG